MTIKNLKANFICLISFFILLISSHLSAQTASITPWRNDAKAVYSIVHDDYSNYVLGIFQNAYPIATQRGIKLSFGAITSACGPTEWANARTMIAQGGHECINHSHNHKCGECSSGNPNCTTVDYGCDGLSTYTTTNFADELNQSDNIIQQQTGKKARFFIHPYDHHTSEILDYLSSLNYLGSRAGMQGRVNPSNFDNPMKLNYFVWGPSGGQETTVAQLNAAVDAAINVGGYTIREFHNVGPGSITNPWGNITVTNYTQHLNYVKTKMDANQVWSATMSEAITYKMQREVYSPNLSYNAQTGLLTVAFATDLTKLKGISPTLFTPSVFVTPITLKIDVTGISGTISATALQNNAVVNYTRTGNILLLNVYPHNGAVTLNVDVCSADTQKPVFSNCPTDINLSTTSTSAIATWTPPSITDNCLPTPIKTSNFEPGTSFPIGSTTVVYNATDAKGNTAIPCIFNILVTQIDPCLTDIEKPNFINCPSNLQDTTSGTSKAVRWTPPTATDNCTTSPAITSNFSPGSIFPVGSTTVRYDAKDARNNEAFPCTFVVIINKVDPCATDTEKPVIVNCPTNINLTTTDTSAVVTWVAPTVIDNCAPSPSIIGSAISGTAFPIGVTTVTYNATDAKGNTAIPCTFTISVVKIDPCATDTIKPIIVNCPANISLTTTGTRAVATWITPTATDNCTPNPEVIWSFTSGTEFPIGVTKVAYDATDDKGNASIPCIFTVTVVKIDPCDTDTIKPIIVNCPTNINLTTTDTMAVATWVAPTATDNCAPTPSVIGSATSGTAFPIGVTTVTYNATDAKGNTAIPCIFTITVVIIDPCATDTEKPVIVNCPANINLTTTGTTAVATWVAPTATDNCAPTPSVIGSATSGTAFPIGVTTVTYNSTDAKGNTAIPCTFTITVVKIDPCATDTEKPVIVNCPTNISLTTTGTTAVATWVAPTATDNCAPTPSVIGSATSGTAFPIGVTTVTYNATDAKGNTAIPCTFTITVVKIDPCATDTEKPVIVNCPTNISLTTTGTTAVATWVAPTATDNCAPTPSVIGSATSGTAFPIGVTTVTYNSTDAKGNTAIPCTFTITVVKIDPCATDTEKPVIVNCPTNISLTTTGTTAVATWVAPTATDNCAPTPSVIGSATSGTAFPIGVTTVTYNATDAKGNTAIPCTFTITVVKIDPCATDTEKPVIVNCPTNISLTTTGTTAVAIWVAPTATDNCAPTPSVIGSATSGTAFPIGVTTVTYNATDTKGNTATPCTFTVSVSTNPTLRDCEALVVSNNNGSINISGITNLATIQVFSSSWSTVYSATVTNPSVNIPNLSTGGYIVKIALYKVANGWTFICEKSFNVTVAIGGGGVCDTDTEKPVFTNCPTNINLTSSGTTAIATWTPPSATDNCTTTPSVTSNFNSGTAFPIGITNVTYNATDAKNNSAVPCTFKVTVTTASSCATDTEKPVFINCPSNINLTTTGSSASATWTAPTATDNCTVNPSVTSTHISGAIFPLGVTTVRYTATDAKNNAAIPCAFVVAVTQVTNVSPCDAYIVKNGGNSIDISGLSNTTTIQIFNATWSPIFNNQTTLASIKIPNIAPGNYYVKLQNYRVNGSWTFLCEKTLNVTVLSTSTALSQSNVEKLSIQASAEMGRVRIEWVTNTGDKNDFYTVQKWVNDKNDFEDLSTVNNVDVQNKLQHHVFYDNQPLSGENLYRVKQVSLNGAIKLTETVKVMYGAFEGVNIYPNPTDSKLFISFKDYTSNDLTVYLYNSIGQPVKVEKANNTLNALLEVDTATLPEGHYLIRVVTKGKKDFTKQIFVAH